MLTPPDRSLTETRPYLEIKPTDEALAPRAVYRALQRLDTQDPETDRVPIYEFLVTAQGTAGPEGTRSLDWHVGVDDGRLDTARNVLDRGLPLSYDVVETEHSYADLLGLPVDQHERANPPDDPALDDPAATTTTTDTNSTTDTPGTTAGQPGAVDAADHRGTVAATPLATLLQALPLEFDRATATSTRTSTTPLATLTEALPTDRVDSPSVPVDHSAIAEFVTPDPRPDTEPPLADYASAAVEWRGHADRREDWMLPLAPLDAFENDDDSRAAWPLSRVFDGLARGNAPAAVQLLVRPRPDWTDDRDWRAYQVAHRIDTLPQAFLDAVSTEEPDYITGNTGDTFTPTDQSRLRTLRETALPSYHEHLPATERQRVADLVTVDSRRSFTVNARAVAVGTDRHAPRATIQRLADALEPLGTRHYSLRPHRYAYGSAAAATLFHRLLERSLATDPTSRRQWLSLHGPTSPAIVADAAALGALCVTGGDALSSDARRALETTPPGKTGIELPPTRILNRYLHADGMTFGVPRDANREPLDTTVALPPDVQQLHTAVFGGSGAGKSALGQQMTLGNVEATDGATVYIDHKGDGAPDAYLRAHHERYGDLEDVYYFRCEEWLPAVPLLSIEPQLEAGVDRIQAVENVVERLSEILAAYRGPVSYHTAKNSVNLLKAVTKAMFDPVHGDDTISIYDPLIALGRLGRDGDLPPVSDRALRERIRNTSSYGQDTSSDIVGGAIERLSIALNNSTLKALFVHAADDTVDKHFDVRDHLDEQCVVLFDTSGFREDPRRLLTLVIVSELWTALNARTTTADPHAELPQVNLVLEEAADVATSDVLGELLAQGRGFGVGVTAMMQFPGQVKDSHPRVYRELINDIGTHITGHVNDPEDLAKPFATGDRSLEDARTRITDLDRGEWLVRPAAPFDETRPNPFICESPPLPPGHPDGDEPLSDTRETDYEARKTVLESRMKRKYGLLPARFTAATNDDATDDHEETPDERAAAHLDPAAATAATHDPPELAAGTLAGPVSLVPYTKRLPRHVDYRDEPPYPLVCTDCDTDYPGSTDGMRNAITCCRDRDAVERDDVPVTQVDLLCSPQELTASDYDAQQLLMVALVYMAHQRRLDADLEYDIVYDSMVRLREYVGIETEQVRELIDDGLIKQDCVRPHTLYTVTPEGRTEIGVGHREGVAHGDGKGDLSETSLHVAMIDAGCRLLRYMHVQDPDSPAETVKRYHEVGDQRLDAVALDADGTVVVALEAERRNNDLNRAVPDDYDKMAACEPDEAIWIVESRETAHAVLQALNDPPDGETRVDTTYSDQYAPQRFRIDRPGLTDVYTFTYLRDTLLPDLQG